MMIVSAIQVAASAFILTVAGSCGRNMLQTSRVAGGSSGEIENLLPVGICSNPETTVNHLQSLKRKELVDLFCSSSAPSDLSEISGEWNGYLLENNGIIMTMSSTIMTHVLFSMGRRWNGKAFAPEGKGINRFLSKKGDATDSEHSFDISIQKSIIQCGKESVMLQYTNYQTPVSLWRTMVDEVRFLPGSTEVLIGFGSMAWSGGMLNSAPFCLWRANPDSKDS
jgi:hypothetical protein